MSQNNYLVLDSDDEEPFQNPPGSLFSAIPLPLIYNSIPNQPLFLSNHLFYPSDLQSLLPNRWLNDKIINFYFELLSSHNPSVYYFSSFLFPMLLSSPMDQIISSFSSVDFLPYNTFFIPINLNSHWSLIKIYANKIIPLDSLRRVPISIIELVKRFYKRIVLGIGRGAGGCRKLPFFYQEEKGIPQQENGDDCGVFCCAYGKYYIGEKYEGFRAEDIPRIRKEILHEILSGEIMY